MIESLTAVSIRNSFILSLFAIGFAHRSHAVFTVEVECRKGKTTTSGRLNIVDLSGSERVNKYVKGGSLVEEEEGRNINLSLHHLQRVVKSIGDGGYVGWRDSMLTWLLKDELRGGGKASFLGTIRMEKEWWGESGETLGFLGRCGKVVVKYKKNIFQDGDGFEVRQARSEAMSGRLLVMWVGDMNCVKCIYAHLRDRFVRIRFNWVWSVVNWRIAVGRWRGSLLRGLRRDWVGRGQLRKRGKGGRGR